jgi:hypothetical protein
MNEEMKKRILQEAQAINPEVVSSTKGFKPGTNWLSRAVVASVKNEDFNPPMSDYFYFDQPTDGLQTSDNKNTDRPSLFKYPQLFASDFKPNRYTLIKHLYDQLQDQGVELDNTGRRYALALAQFHELTGAEVPQHHDWEGLRDQLGSIRNKKIMVTIPRDRDVIPRPLSGTTDGIYPVADPKYFKNPFYHKS